MLHFDTLVLYQNVSNKMALITNNDAVATPLLRIATPI
mgnify:CR=1 FL=1